MQLPIGYDDFAKVREKKLDLVDKTLLIQHVIDDNTSEVTVIVRPRRFGKTLNLSMLHYFFAAQAYGRKTQGLFDGLKISNLGESYMKHQGRYPVVFVTLKEVRDHTFQNALEKLSLLLSNLYAEHSYLLQSNQLDLDEKAFFATIKRGTLNQLKLEEAFYRLIYYLFKHHGQKVWLLIDEYDTPIQSSYLHGYYPEMTNLMRNLFSAALKTNPYLERAVVTGILRIAKESLFSGLNNVKTYTLLDDAYSEYFGFTEDEVTILLEQAGLTAQTEAIQHWYNGYRCGKTVIYNPWSIANCLNANGDLRPYWVNTSSNDLIRELMARGDESLKDDLRRLLSNQPINALITEYIVFGDLANDNNALWNVLLWSGYLKAILVERQDVKYKVQLMPPNHEVYLLYRSIIQSWFDQPLGYSKYEVFLNTLIQGNVGEFTLQLQDCLQDTFSIFDVTGKHPEKFYHGFVLGLMVSLSETHDIQSNKESGYGRYDVILIPKDRTALGIVLEFKTVRNLTDTALSRAAEEALQQTINRNYAQQLHSVGIDRVLHLGLAFYQKEVAVADLVISQ